MSQDSPPSTFEIPTNLAEEYAIPLAKLIEQNPSYDFVATGSLVFHQGRQLLIQRAASDSHPGRWENPGGGCDREDETILHAVARELWEETGLHVTRFVRQVGGVVKFNSRSGKSIVKFSFEVEVSETGALGGEGSSASSAAGAGADRQAGGESEIDLLQNLDKIPIRLDPKEHQAYIWATEEQVLNGIIGDGNANTLGFISEQQHHTTVEGFRLHLGKT